MSTLYFTSIITPSYFRESILILVTSEILIVTFSAITLSASSIAKEREDGSLDLLLTTAMTPQMYLRGKVSGLVMHLFPMVIAPCITMMSVGLFVYINPTLGVVPDQVVGNASIQVPLALTLPALLTPVVFIPFIAFCMTLGLLWSMRSQGTISAIVTTLILVCIVTFGLGLCMSPAGQMIHVGSVFASLSPITSMYATMSSTTVLPTLMERGPSTANISMAVSSIVAGVIWTFISYGLLKSMSASFVVTVRKLAGRR